MNNDGSQGVLQSKNSNQKNERIRKNCDEF